MSDKAYKSAFSGILLALSFAFSSVEMLIPLPLGVKPGFSNLPVMVAMSELNVGISLSIVILKSVFVLLTRGVTAFFMSVTGGLLSFLIMLIIFKKTKSSFLLISVCGGLAHNIGQITAASVILNHTAIIYYLPILVISGCIAGAITGVTANILIPIIKPFLRRTK